jgi:Cupin-like domain
MNKISSPRSASDSAKIGSVPSFNPREIESRIFNKKFCHPQQPAVFRKSISGWKTDAWSQDYLKDRLGRRQVRVSHNELGIFDYNEGAQTGPVTKQTMSFAEAIDLIYSEKGSKYYIQQESLKHTFSELQRDITRPELLDRWKIIVAVNLWLGGMACKSPLHFDGNDNFLVQVKGDKKVFLFPPSETEHLYPAIGKRLSHLSLLNVFAPVDADTFPLYEKAQATQLCVTLHAGDTLYIPRGWWHAVESLDTSISINFWWVAADSPREVRHLAGKLMANVIGSQLRKWATILRKRRSL